MYGGPASDSETDDFYQVAKKQAFGAKQGYTNNDLDDFDDISEHSSDDKDSDSDGQSSPIQKQLKKQNKRKNRKMEAIKKAQAVAATTK